MQQAATDNLATAEYANTLNHGLTIVKRIPPYITTGLLSTNVAFGFMGVLGALSLVGVLTKNTIVLIDKIDMNIAAGKESYNAILDFSVSRMRPVMMAASMTILGMAPLFK